MKQTNKDNETLNYDTLSEKSIKVWSVEALKLHGWPRGTAIQTTSAVQMANRRAK